MRTPTFYNAEVNRIVDISQSSNARSAISTAAGVTYWSTGAATITTTMTIGQGQTRLDKMSVKHRHMEGGGAANCALLDVFSGGRLFLVGSPHSVDKEIVSCFTRKLSSSVAYWLGSRS